MASFRECYTPPLMPSSDRLFTPRLFVICGFAFTAFLAGFMLFPTAPFHILDLGGSKFTAGLFLGFLTYASAFSAPFTGAFADRFGKRLVLLIASLTLAALSLLYAATPSYVVLLLLVPLHGLLWSGLLSASAAQLVDEIPPSRRAEGLAYWGLAIVAAIAVAPPFAFWLYERGWLWVCVASMAFNLAMAGIAFGLKETSHHQASGAKGGYVEWGVLGVSVTFFLVTFGYGGITSFVALYAEESGGSSRSLYFTALAVAIFFSRPIQGRLADRIGHRKVLIPCLALSAVGLGLLVPGGTVGWLLASAVTFGVGLGSYPVYSAYVVQHVSPARRAAAFGGILAMFDAGIGTGSMTMGYVIEVTGYATAFGLAACLAALAVPYFVMTESRYLRGGRKAG
jgi:MFS family permease